MSTGSMKKQIVAAEVLNEEDVRRLEAAGYKPVVRWERFIEGASDGEGVTVGLASGDALVEVAIREKRQARRARRNFTSMKP